MVLIWYYDNVPRKIRELISDLESAGFVDRGGRGSHRNFKHPSGAKITVSGNLGDDAKQYQERNVQKAIREANK
jgi:predicted RNA binding protein YcfA (HicA-like mRNA interferase family)